MNNILASARTILATTPQRWASLTQTVPTELLARRPLPEEWSPAECLEHMIEVERSYQARVDAFLAGRDLPVINPDDTVSKAGERRTPADLSGEFFRLRALSLDKIAKLSAGDLQRQALHPELGRVTLSEMIHTWAAHDLNHTMQAERALMQPFLQGCGPWIQYLSHHVMAS